jgi:hypothetical protein
VSKGHWRFTSSEVKRLIKAVEESELVVTQIRVDGAGITLNTQPGTAASKALPSNEGEAPTATEEWKVE